MLSCIRFCIRRNSCVVVVNLAVVVMVIAVADVIVVISNLFQPLTSEERKKSDPEGKEFHGALSTVVKMGLVSK